MATKFETRYLQLLQNSPYIQSVARPGMQIARINYYAYNIIIGSAAVPLVAGVPQQGTITTQSDSDFAVTYLSACCENAANGPMSFGNNLTLQIQDTSTGKFFFNQAAPLILVSGGGGFPYVFPAPRVVNPNSGLLITALNRDTNVSPIGCYVAMHGVRIWYASGNPA